MHIKWTSLKNTTKKKKTFYRLTQWNDDHWNSFVVKSDYILSFYDRKFENQMKIIYYMTAKLNEETNDHTIPLRNQKPLGNNSYKFDNVIKMHKYHT